MNKKIDVLVFTCYKYRTLWPYFFEFFLKNVPHQYIDDIFVFTDKIDDNFKIDPKVTFIETDTNDFFERIKKFGDLSKNKYFLLVLDDYFFTSKIQNAYFEKVLNHCLNEDLDYLKLSITHKNTYIKNKSSKEFARLKTTKPYSVDFYPSIWKKEFLFNCEKKWKFEGRSIWDFEGKINLINDGNCEIFLNKEFEFIDVIRKGKVRREAHQFLTKKFNINLLEKGWKIMSVPEKIKDIWIPRLSIYTPTIIKKHIKRIATKKGAKFFSED